MQLAHSVAWVPASSAVGVNSLPLFTGIIYGAHVFATRSKVVTTVVPVSSINPVRFIDGSYSVIHDRQRRETDGQTITYPPRTPCASAYAPAIVVAHDSQRTHSL